MGILYDWYITTGNAGRLCVLPERMMKNRESLRHIRCTGIVDAVEQLKNYEKEAQPLSCVEARLRSATQVEKLDDTERGCGGFGSTGR